MKRKVKTTVIRRECYQDLVQQYIAKLGVGKCSILRKARNLS